MCCYVNVMGCDVMVVLGMVGFLGRWSPGWIWCFIGLLFGFGFSVEFFALRDSGCGCSWDRSWEAFILLRFLKVRRWGHGNGLLGVEREANGHETCERVTQERSRHGQYIAG